MTVYYAVTVDTEEEWDWDSGWPVETGGTENIHQLPQFQQLCEQFDACVTYFVNYSVWQSRAAADVIKSLYDRPACEIGMHMHPWNTPPISAQPVDAFHSFTANLEPAQIHAKMRQVYQCFVDHDIAPRSFRGGRYSSGPVAQQFLHEHGFRADSSIVPFTHWDTDGAPDFRHLDRTPVRLQHEQYGPLWELPLTLGYTREPEQRWAKLFNRFESDSLRQLRVIPLLERSGLVRRIWLNFEYDQEQSMLPLLAKLERDAPPFICFTIHSSSLLPGGSPYNTSDADSRRILNRISDTLQWLQRRETFQPATISHIAELLEQQYSCE